LTRSKEAMTGVESAGRLCLECGLCCDGTLFADVELKGRAEAVAVESLGLEVEEEDGRELLIQPCRALDGTMCSIYRHRPECCRTFECGLLMGLQRGKLQFDDAMAVVTQVKELSFAGEIRAACEIIEERFLQPPA
jgi:Fe-S-cluster containining protein